MWYNIDISILTCWSLPNLSRKLWCFTFPLPSLFSSSPKIWLHLAFVFRNFTSLYCDWISFHFLFVHFWSCLDLIFQSFDSNNLYIAKFFGYFSFGNFSYLRTMVYWNRKLFRLHYHSPSLPFLLLKKEYLLVTTPMVSSFCQCKSHDSSFPTRIVFIDLQYLFCSNT